MPDDMDLASIRAIEDYRVAAERLVQVLSLSFIRESTQKEFLYHTQICLLDLYKAALALPEVSPDDVELAETRISPEESRELNGALSTKLGTHDVYSEIFDSTEKVPDPYLATISMDLCEIYEDIKEALSQIELNPPSADLIWDLRFSCTSHWGRHVTSAIRAIYCIQMT